MHRNLLLISVLLPMCSGAVASRSAFCTDPCDAASPPVGRLSSSDSILKTQFQYTAMQDEHREKDAPLSFDVLQAFFEHQRSFNLRMILSAGDGAILGRSSVDALQVSFEHQRSFNLRTILSAGDGAILGRRAETKSGALVRQATSESTGSSRNPWAPARSTSVRMEERMWCAEDVGSYAGCTL
ncbi:hypothetical protein K438DRAFT_1751350 [Mycena galopus ATCC 62051]|nr:hypothetical protein K438DRAFT_1751350 [Mycena galopus ATCC 62051]